MLAGIAQTVVRAPRATIGLWVLAAALATCAAPSVGDRLTSGGGTIEATESARAKQRQQSRFAEPLDRVLVVTLEVPQPLDAPASARVVDSLASALEGLPFVRRVDTWRTTHDSTMRGRDGRSTLIAVVLSSDTTADDAATVDSTRAAVRGTVARLELDRAQYRVHVTGDAALDTDMRRIVEHDSRTAELRLLPITLVVLVLAFGALVAAALPVLVGALAIWLALALIALVAAASSVSVFVLNIITMLGLGVGIDYSLLIVTRFREEMKAGASAADAAVYAATTAGRAVVTSGITVFVGLGALLITPLTETHSVGLGGLVVVAIAVILAITLLPAMLALLGDRVNAPRSLAGLLGWYHARIPWSRWAQAVTSRPVAALTAGLVIMGACAAPALRLNIGLPATGWFPATSDAGQGVSALQRMKVGAVSQPVQVVVEAPWGSYMTSSTALAALRALTDSIRSVPGVRRVTSVVSYPKVRAALPLIAPDGDLSMAPETMRRLLDTYVSIDGRVALASVVLQDTTSLTSAMTITQRIRQVRAHVPQAKGMTVLVGGFAAEALDLQAAMLDVFPLMVKLVLGVTAVMLAFSFRSLLVPAKAVVLNALSVLASFGLIVLVFQQGWGARFFRLAGPTQAIFIVVPVLVFAIVFGLSMDYEVFLLSRIKESYDQTRDNAGAVAAGLSASASTITSAALIMILVFGAFAFARAIVMQFLGFGLAIAVLLDATVVRMLLVPAIMMLAGKWNWWPGSRMRRLAAGPS